MRFTISLSNSVSPVVEKDGINNSSRVACSSCIPARLSSSSRQATVVSRSREVRSKSNKKEHETAFLSDGRMLTIVSTRARCSCSMLRVPVLFVCNDGRLHISRWAGLKTDTFDSAPTSRRICNMQLVRDDYQIQIMPISILLVIFGALMNIIIIIKVKVLFLNRRSYRSPRNYVDIWV